MITTDNCTKCICSNREPQSETGLFQAFSTATDSDLSVGLSEDIFVSACGANTKGWPLATQTSMARFTSALMLSLHDVFSPVCLCVEFHQASEQRERAREQRDES